MRPCPSASTTPATRPSVDDQVVDPALDDGQRLAVRDPIAACMAWR